ncbi:MAG: hypothetical protein NTX50_06825 [Candidatus Sumerlaeota bacterium]|nr:hypothetical protein [Candidatus Sumerlaeota bacterium]
MLLHPRFMGLAAGQVDVASLAAAPAYCYARRVSQGETLSGLVFSAAREARCRIVMENGVVCLSAPPADFVGPGAVFVFDSNLAFNAEMPRERSRAEDIVNAVTLWSGEDYRLGNAPMERRFRFAYRMEDAGSQTMPWGRRPLDWPLLWHQRLLPPTQYYQWADLAGYTLARLGYKRMLARIMAPPAVAHLERGDVARIDYGGEMPGQTFGEVVEIRGGAMKSFEVVVSANPALLDMWRSDEDTRMILCASIGHVYVHINGVRVASLDVAGCLRLRGGVIENGLVAEAMDAPIKYVAAQGRVLFGVGEEGVYQSVFSIDTSGNLRLRGGMAERMDLSGELFDGEICYDSTPERFAISVDGVHPELIYAAPEARLKLAGEVMEKALWL